MPKEVALKSGDILLSNWVSVFGSLSALANQRWGHVGLVVNVDGVPHIYEISVESGKPTTIPVSDYIRKPNLKELGVRQLQNPLSRRDEKEYKDALLTHETVRYPHLSGVLARLLGSGTLRSADETNEYLCSELIYSVFKEMSWVGSEREVFGDRPILPDAYIPGILPLFDGLYESTIKIVVRRSIPRDVQIRMLRPQLDALVQHLVD